MKETGGAGKRKAEVKRRGLWSIFPPLGVLDIAGAPQ